MCLTCSETRVTLSCCGASSHQPGVLCLEHTRFKHLVVCALCKLQHTKRKQESHALGNCFGTISVGRVLRRVLPRQRCWVGWELPGIRQAEPIQEEVPGTEA